MFDATTARRRRGLRAAWGAVIVAAAFAGPSADAQDRGGADAWTPSVTAGYVTTAREANSAAGKKTAGVPGPDVVPFVWSDQPAVVHLPFTLDLPPGESGHVACWIGWDGPTENVRTESAEPGSLAGGGAFGFTHLGASGGAAQDVAAPSRRFEPLPDAPSVTVSRGIGSGAAMGLARTSRMRRDAGPFVGTWFSARFGPGAPRGPWAVWFTVKADALWRQHYAGNGGPYDPATLPREATFTFRASFVVVRRERSPSSAEIDSFLGRSSRALPDLALFDRPADAETKLTSRRNGWLLERIHTAPAHDPARTDAAIDVGASGAGFRAPEIDVSVDFPVEVWDWATAVVRVQGTLRDAKLGAFEVDVDTLPPNFGTLRLPEDVLRSRDGRGKNHRRPVPLLGPQVRGRSYSPQFVAQAHFERMYPHVAVLWHEPTAWPAEREEGLRDGVFTFLGDAAAGHEWRDDHGSCVLFGAKVGTVGCAAVTYRRVSELPADRASAPPAPAADAPRRSAADDGYWPWYRDFCALSREVQNELDADWTAAGLLGFDNERERKRIRVLTDALRAHGDYRRDGGYVESALDAASVTGDLGPMSQATVDRMKREIESRKAELARGLARVAELGAGSVARIEALLAKMDEQDARSAAAGRRRADPERWRARWERDRVTYLPRLLLVGGDVEGWDRAMAGLDARSLPPDLRLELATVYLDRGMPARGLAALRSVVRVAPDGPVGKRAATVLAGIEAELLDQIAAKMDGEVGRARKRFADYLEGRGIYEQDAEGVLGVLEFVWTAFTTGPGGIASAAAGRPDLLEDAASRAQAEASEAWLGLRAMISLARRGTTIERAAAGLGRAELARRLPLRRPDGSPFGDSDFAALETAIRTAVQLPEVEAILSENEDALRLALSEARFDPDAVQVYLDTSVNRAEFGGDLLSGKNLLMLGLPFSVHSIGGRSVGSWRLWGLTEASNPALAAASTGARVITGQEALAIRIGWARALEKLSGFPAAQRITHELQRIHESGGLVWKATWGTAPVVASFSLSMGIVHLANEHGGPQVAAATEAILMTFLFDPSLCATLLRRAGNTTDDVVRLSQAYRQAADAAAEELGRSRAAIREMSERVSGSSSSAGRGTQSRPSRTSGSPDSRPTNPNSVPGSDPVEDLSYIRREAEAALARGDEDDARRALLAAGDVEVPAVREVERMSQSASKIDEIVAGDIGEVISRAVPHAPPKRRIDLRMPLSSGPRLPADELEALGDFRRLQGDFDGAARAYKASLAERHGAQGDLLGADDLLAKLRIVRDASAARATLPKSPAVRRDVFTPDEVADALSPNAVRTPVKGKTLNEGNVFEVRTSKGHYALKAVVGETSDPDYLLNNALSEAAAGALGDLFGAHVPAAFVRPIRDGDGRIVAVKVLTRWIDGPELKHMDVGELLALKPQIARHKLFSWILGDFDRHLGNYRRAADGRVVGIDAGLGELTRFRPNRTEYIVNHFQKHRADLDHVANLKMLEESITYQDVAPAFEQAKRLFAEQEDLVRGRLREAYSGMDPDPAIVEGLVDRALRTMRARLDSLEPHLIDLNQRSDFPLDAKLFETGLRAIPGRGGREMRRAA